MVAMLLPYFLCQEVESKSVFGQVKMLLMGEVQCQYLRQLLENWWAEREGWWKCAEHVEAFLLWIGLCVLCLVSSASSCRRPSETPVYSCLFCSWTSTPCAFLLAVRTKLVPSVPAEWRVFISTGMQLGPGLKWAPWVWLLYITWKTQGDKVGAPSRGCVPALAPVTVFPPQAEEAGINYLLFHFIFLLIGFKRSPICLVVFIDFLDIHFNRTSQRRRETHFDLLQVWFLCPSENSITVEFREVTNGQGKV